MRIKATLTKLILVFSLFYITSSVAAIEKSQEFQIFHLDNGQTVMIKEVHSNPIVSVSTWVRTGSINEDDSNNGVSHFLEHLLFKGTYKHPTGEIDRIMESTGAEFNAATSKDYTYFYLTTSSKYLSLALELHADMVINAAILPDELDKERKVVIEEINRSNDSPDRQVYYNLNELLFKEHPYKYDTLGTKEMIATIPREKILEYYHKWYVPANLTTIIVGDVNTEEVLKQIKQDFGDVKAQRMSLPVYQEESELSSPKVKVEGGNYKQAYIDIGFHSPSINDVKETCALDLAAIIIGQGRASRLYKILKQDENLVNSISASNYSMKDKGIFIFDAELQPDNLNKAKEIILNEIKKMKTELVTPEELKRAKTQISRDFIYQNESVSDIASSAGYYATISSFYNYLKYQDDINAITAEDIKDAVSKYLDTNKMATSILEPKEKAKIAKTKINQTQTAQIIDNPKDLSKANNPEKIVLKNGLTLLYRYNPVNDIVSMNIFVKGGKLYQNKPGLASLVTNLLMKGTQSRTAQDIARETENLGIEIVPTLADDYILITSKSTKEDFPEAFWILSDVLKNANFEKAEIEKSKISILNSIKANEDSPFSYAMQKFYSEIYATHPYGQVGDKVASEIPNITREDITDYYKNYFQPSNMIVSVVGNISKQKLEEYLTQAWPNEAGMLETKKIPLVQDLKKSEVVKTEKQLDAASICMGWLAPGIKDKDYVTLKLIDTILGNGLTSRLGINIREKNGMAYTVGSMYPSHYDKSAFIIHVGTDPKNVNAVLKGFKNETDNLQTTLVDDKELENAKSKLIGQFSLAHESNSDQAFYLGFYEDLGKGYNFDKQYPDAINNVTAEDIRIFAKQLFSQPYVLSIVAPKQALDSLKE